MNKLFGSDSIVGVAVTEVTCEMIMQAGRAFVLALSKKINRKLTIFIGKDTRISSDIFEDALTAGICSAGADVKKLGVIPSSAVSYLVKRCNADGGVMICASHNSFEFNGLKLFSSAGYKISDDIEDEIETAVFYKPETIKIMSHDQIGSASVYKDAEWDYLRYLLKLEKTDLTGMRVVIDCANGSASSTAEKLYSALGARCFMINNKPDGNNINNKCGVMYSATMSKIIKAKRADIGIVFDGDASKCLALDENGDMVDGDQLMALIAMDLKNELRLVKNTIVITDMSNMGLKNFAAENDINVLSSKSGEKCIMEKLLDGGYSIGGEQNGRIIFPDILPTCDGLLTALRCMYALKRSGKKMSEISSVMEKYPQVMINVSILPQYKETWKNNSDITDFIERKQYGLGKDGRIFVREIGTEPLIRVLVEGKSFETINSCAVEISDKIKEQTRPEPSLSGVE